MSACIFQNEEFIKNFWCGSLGDCMPKKHATDFWSLERAKYFPENFHNEWDYRWLELARDYRWQNNIVKQNDFNGHKRRLVVINDNVNHCLLFEPKHNIVHSGQQSVCANVSVVFNSFRCLVSKRKKYTLTNTHTHTLWIRNEFRALLP